MIACEVAVLEDAVDEHEGVPAAARLAAHLLREVRGDTGRYGEVRARGCAARLAAHLGRGRVLGVG